MIEFEVKQFDNNGDFIRDAMMGPHSLAMEIDHLPVGWRLEIIRTARATDPPAEGVQEEDYKA